MGRKRVPESEKIVSICVNIPKYIIDLMELEGKPKHVIESLIKEKYQEKMVDKT